MKILYLCADPYVADSCPLPPVARTRAICSAFVRAGHSVTLLTTDARPADWSGVSARVVTVPVAWLGQDEAGWAWVAGSHFSQAAERLVSEGAYDFIFEQFSAGYDTGASLSAAFGLPLILEVTIRGHGTIPRHAGNQEDHLSRWIQCRQFRTASRLVVSTEEARKHAVAYGVKPQHIDLITDHVTEFPSHEAVTPDPYDRYAARIATWAAESPLSGHRHTTGQEAVQIDRT